ncbi:small ribosomal subunit Rsm22 family protein [Phenylobacterium sp.]|jgi:ribosomal protein RSM22 (predicted rRNA methylase)|uniref:small ribosomal subunit Rsm22 family protein n=1 Tax=Phenylobacterium sp. TaxID=1871053 RepID=UPI002F94739D
MSELPAPLRAAIARELEGVGRKGLAERAGATSATYRAGGTSAAAIRSAEDALAYALTRLPATYAACVAVFAEAARMAPGFAPKRLLDAGSGTAAASWAAAGQWELEALTWLDASAPFLDMAGRLAEDGPLPQADRLRADLTGAGPWPRADLVVASYALAEIAEARQADVVRSLWAATEGLLALVEPGTPAGFGRILAARSALIAHGAEVLAPCPHARDCPLASPDWCHFSIRLPRSREHRMAKGAELPFEDEKFAYLIAARPGIADADRGARVLAHPRAGKPGIELKLCGPQGLESRFVARREKQAHAKARRLGWGDAL